MNYKTLYLILAVLGAAIPCIFFAGFIQENGFDLMAFLEAAYANGAAGGLTSDLLISSFAFWAVMIEMWRSDKGPAPWGFIVVNLLIGLSFALPLYLFVRHFTRPVHAL
jgi:hypothetical protein